MNQNKEQTNKPNERARKAQKALSEHALFDGAIGTALYEKGFYINKPFEELNITNPHEVQKLHSEYLAAGALVLTTNTFAATLSQLRASDLEKDLVPIILGGLKSANQARESRRDIWVGLSVGPLGDLLEPLGSVGLDEAEKDFKNTASIASEAAKDPGYGYDLYILETFTNLNELEAAIKGIRSVDKERFILASISVKSQEVDRIQRFAQRFGKSDQVDFLGLNCSEGPSDLFASLKKFVSLTSKPIVIQPNAGTPRHVNGRYFYLSTPDYLAKFAKRFLEAGAQAVGGCCGTGPEHIEAMSRSVKMVMAQMHGDEYRLRVETQVRQPHTEIQKEEAPIVANLTQSRVLATLAAGKKVISVELLPPLGTNTEKFLASVDKLKSAGIRFINIPDGARASTRLNSMHLSAYIENVYKGEVCAIPHYTTRDRNLIALQSDLLGAYVNGVRDVLMVTGDPPKLGSNREATAVYDIDSIGLTYLARCLNENRSPAGDKLKQGTAYGIGVAANPTAIDLALEYRRWCYKVESGADYAVTQPIFEKDSFYRWRDKLGKDYKPHLVGVWPLVSFRNAEFMSQEVPGVHVPENVLKRMEKHSDSLEDARKEGVQIASELIESIKNDCEGFCVSAPLGLIDPVLQSLSGLH